MLEHLYPLLLPIVGFGLGLVAASMVMEAVFAMVGDALTLARETIADLRRWMVRLGSRLQLWIRRAVRPDKRSGP